MFRVFGTRFAQHLSAAGTLHRAKAEGDISSVFGSLSKDKSSPLPPRFAAIKRDIVADNIDALYDSWRDLLPALEEEAEVIRGSGNRVIPIIDFQSLDSDDNIDKALLDRIRHRGVCVVRNVFKPSEALNFKADIIKYIKANPNTKAYPPDDPQVFELYWSPSQVAARADPRMLRVQRFFISLWHKNGVPLSDAPVLTYADRLRIRRPGDARFALGPHVDGGSVERWEDAAYRASYRAVFEGRWRAFDPFDFSSRADARMSMYDMAGGCSVFRAWQGWLSMSATGPTEGTLRVLPLTKAATAYWLLRPFFSPPRGSASLDGWAPDVESLYLHGASPGRGHELSEATHPHLDLANTVVSVPRVEPGDVVMWQGDLIHAVESAHRGSSDSSVMYIPAVPSTPTNLRYIAAQKETFMEGLPPPDFPGGKGESSHIGRATQDLIQDIGGVTAMKAMGF